MFDVSGHCHRCQFWTVSCMEKPQLEGKPKNSMLPKQVTTRHSLVYPIYQGWTRDSYAAQGPHHDSPYQTAYKQHSAKSKVCSPGSMNCLPHQWLCTLFINPIPTCQAMLSLLIPRLCLSPLIQCISFLGFVWSVFNLMYSQITLVNPLILTGLVYLNPNSFFL